MWLLSKEKEKDAWPVRSPGTDESAQEDVSSLAIEGELETAGRQIRAVPDWTVRRMQKAKNRQLQQGMK